MDTTETTLPRALELRHRYPERGRPLETRIRGTVFLVRWQSGLVVETRHGNDRRIDRRELRTMWRALSRNTPRSDWPAEATNGTYLEAIFADIAGARLAALAPERLRTRVYVARLDRKVAGKEGVASLNPLRDNTMDCLYVGTTSRTPEERFQQHKAGIKDGRGYVRDYGVGLAPELYEHLKPMPREEALRTERLLADWLRCKGYTVTGGH